MRSVNDEVKRLTQEMKRVEEKVIEKVHNKLDETGKQSKICVNNFL
jgi:hypothetical protein